MLKSLFSLTVLHYPQVIKAAAALILVGAWAAVVPTTTDWAIALTILAVITPACVASFILADQRRFYVMSVLLLCAIHMALIAYVSVNFYILNASPVYMSALIDITIAGLLLGGWGATVVTIYDLILLIIGEIVMFSGVIPKPATAPILSQSSQLSGASVNATIILVVYGIVVFFAYVVRKGQNESEARGDKLQANNNALLAIQAEELHLGRQVSALAQRVSISVEQQSTAVQEQASQSGYLATALTELQQNIQLINEASQNVKRAVDDASRDARSGKEATDKALNALTRISSTVEQMAQQINNLTAEARQVNSVLDLISEVADETRMLALNATIEAVSVGQEGTRFSIIADEVGSLAERTRKAVSEISTLVNNIEGAAKEAIETSSYGLTQSKESTSLTGAAGLAYQDILTSVNNTSSLVGNIAAASDQQRRASESAVANVQQLSLTAKQVVAASSNLVTVVHELSVVADSLVQRSTTSPAATLEPHSVSAV